MQVGRVTGQNSLNIGDLTMQANCSSICLGALLNENGISKKTVSLLDQF